jgi:RNA polymerase sigma-70 factor (ECF subfamily)
LDHQVPDSDQQIIQEILGGKSRRFAVLVDRYKDRGMTLAVRLLGGREEAEEVLQDAFVRAFRGLREFRSEAKFATWFYRILYNLCITRITRRKSSFLGMEREEADGSGTLFVDPDAATPYKIVETRDLSAILLEEVARLPDRFRAVVTLFYLEEMSYEDLAATLNLPLGTVKTNLFRARVLLRRRVLQRTHEKVPVS